MTTKGAAMDRNQLYLIQHLNLPEALYAPDPVMDVDDRNRELEDFQNSVFFDFEYNQKFALDESAPIDEHSMLDNLSLPGSEPIMQPLDREVKGYSYERGLSTTSEIHESSSLAKRKLSLDDGYSVQSDQPMMEELRQAVEEDKRRRNTLASARFRAKKKVREKALERDAKVFQDRVSVLEGRVKQLELENQWLRSLVKVSSDEFNRNTKTNSEK